MSSKLFIGFIGEERPEASVLCFLCILADPEHHRFFPRFHPPQEPRCRDHPAERHRGPTSSRQGGEAGGGGSSSSR